MPKPLFWSAAQDAALRQMRAAGAPWSAIAEALGVSRNAAAERAKRLKARIARAPIEALEAPDRPALPPGHALSWGLLVEGTVLEGAEYRPPGAMGRRHQGVVGDS